MKLNVEIFETRREFNNKFPSKLYICSTCGSMITDTLICPQCNWMSNGLFKTMGNGYQYIIKEESDEIFEIFKPIELQQQEGENDG